MHSTARSNTFRNSTRFQGSLTWLTGFPPKKPDPQIVMAHGLGKGQGAMTSRIITLAVAASASYQHLRRLWVSFPWFVQQLQHAIQYQKSNMHLKSNLFFWKIAMKKHVIELLQRSCWRNQTFNRTWLLSILSCKEFLSSKSGSLFGQGCLIASYFDSPGPLVHAVEPFRMIACKEFIASWSWLHGGWLEKLLFGFDRLFLPLLHQLNKSWGFICCWAARFFPNNISFGVFGHSKGVEAKRHICLLGFFGFLGQMAVNTEQVLRRKNRTSVLYIFLPVSV